MPIKLTGKLATNASNSLRFSFFFGGVTRDRFSDRRCLLTGRAANMLMGFHNTAINKGGGFKTEVQHLDY
ncbi:hypothetical protein EDE11_1408 [Methylomonas methanica]|uniref:Uncharacterized protein n=1 Tax=Methylomonas methanica TaxID=421 RepID=A0ABY2CFL5_METMH|nr:hypothetical protein EDE11_1408 [Methylomonas methanica]